MRAAAARELPLRVAPRRTHLQHLQRMGCEEIATMSFSIMDVDRSFCQQRMSTERPRPGLTYLVIDCSDHFRRSESKTTLSPTEHRELIIISNDYIEASKPSRVDFSGAAS
jgi:hypothetical protein